MRAAVLLLACAALAAAANDRPIIGILSLPNDQSDQHPGQSYIAASYVKWVESAGARVAPILFTDSAADIKTLLASLNGVLFTGGGASFTNPDGSLTPFAASAQLIVNEVIAQNKAGVYYPLWATCLGFELVNFLVSGANMSVLVSGLDSENLTLPLTLTGNAGSSRLFADVGPELMSVLTKQAVTMNNHVNGVSPTTYGSNPILPTFFTVLSTNQDRKGVTFVSTMEAINYPIYITQWHPEKPQFEWWSKEGINHSYDSIQANSYFSRFFVNEARGNNNIFPSAPAAVKALIYNYAPVYTGPGSFEQCYFFA